MRNHFFLDSPGLKCKYHFSIWKDTLFDGTQLDHLSMLKILNLWNDGVPCLLLAHALERGKESVYSTLELMR